METTEKKSTKASGNQKGMNADSYYIKRFYALCCGIFICVPLAFIFSWYAVYVQVFMLIALTYYGYKILKSI